MNYSDVTANVVKIVIEAGKKILDIYNSGDFEVEMKSDNSPLTLADRVGNAYITENVSRLYPDFGILSEESKMTNDRLDKSHVWVIDPLDGTKEFIKRNGEFTVNVALVEDGIPVSGVVGIPVKDEIYYASKGGGAYHMDASGRVSQIKTSKRDEIQDMVMVKSRSHASEALQHLIDTYPFAEVKESGSSIKICLIADGLADVYFRFGFTNEWDICAAHCVLQEAGGLLTDGYGDIMNYNKKDPLNRRGFIASNNSLHDKLIDIASQYLPDS